MDHYAYSSAGELGSKILVPCVAIVFTDNTVMIEHRPDPFLYHKRDNNKRIYKVDSMHLIWKYRKKTSVNLTKMIVLFG